MKKSSGRIILVVTLVLSIFMATNAFADTIVGAISEITTKPNSITIDGEVFYGIKINYLENQYNIVLEIGDEVSVDYYEFTCSNGIVKNMATSITIGDVTVTRQ